MPFERDDKAYRPAEKLHGLGLGLTSDPSGEQSFLPSHERRSRRQQPQWRSLAISLGIIALFVLVLVGPAVPLRQLLHNSISRDVDALRTSVGLLSTDTSIDDTQVPAQDLGKRQDESTYRLSYGPGQGRRASIAAVIEHTKREASHQRRSAAAWRASLLDEEIAHKVADLEGPGGVAAAKVYTSSEHYDEDKALGAPRSFDEAVSEEGGASEDAGAEGEAQPIVEDVEEELLESTPAEPNRYNLPAAPKAPWSLENEINAKQKEAGRLASS